MVVPAAVVVLGFLTLLFIFLSMLAFAGTPFVRGWMVAGFWGAAGVVTLGFVVWFFRVPGRPVLRDEASVFSPCDGRVIGVEQVTEDEVTGERRLKISVFMSITDVHLNWFPVGGEVVYFKHHNGHYHIASHPKESEDNEHTTIAVESGRGVVVFRQIAGFVARRIVSYARVGAVVEQNTPCGFIKFGSRMNVYVPAGAEVLVGKGDRVVGSQTVIARLGI